MRTAQGIPTAVLAAEDRGQKQAKDKPTTARIHIQSFGPVRRAQLDVTDIIVLNGLQSSGKSTIAKLIYFFKSLPETLYQNLIIADDPTADLKKKLVIACRNRLMDFFGTTKHMKGLFLKYTYAENKDITVQYENRSGHARVKFSNALMAGLTEIAQRIKHYREHTEGDRPWDLSAMQFFRADQMRFFHSVRREVKQLFVEPREMLYIPAGRSLVTTLSEELKEVESFRFDPLMKEFVSRINLLRRDFTKDLDEMIEDRKKLSAEPIDFDRLRAMKTLIEEILQGRYRVEKGEERILLDDQNYVKIRYSSSGQQESLWILHLLFLAVLEGQAVFGVFEEPEAHLYPLTQYHLVKLIALYLGAEENQAIITTHSPYVMASLNTLLLAHQAATKNRVSTVQVIKSHCWLDGARVSAYFVEKGSIRDIYDRDSGIIDPQFIDHASETINDDFDRLLDLVQA